VQTGYRHILAQRPGLGKKTPSLIDSKGLRRPSGYRMTRENRGMPPPSVIVISATYLFRHGALMARKPSAWNRFFAARRKRGLSAKAIGREWRAKKRGAKSRRTTRASPTRRGNPKPKGVKRVARRKNININLLDLGGGLVLADQFLGPTALDSILKLQMPNLSGLPARLRSPRTQGALLKTGISIVVLKTALKGFAKQVGAIGPIKLKI